MGERAYGAQGKQQQDAEPEQEIEAARGAIQIDGPADSVSFGALAGQPGDHYSLWAQLLSGVQKGLY